MALFRVLDIHYRRDEISIKRFPAKPWVLWKVGISAVIWNEWHSHIDPLGFRKRTFTGPDGRRYRWDMSYRNVVVSVNIWFRLGCVISFVVWQLSLDDASRTEVARHHRATLGIIGKRRSASLDIAPQAERMLDLVILTFIYVEKLRMDKEKRQRRAAGGGP